MPFKSHDELISAEKINMQRGGSAPAGLEDLKRGDFSLHHILPYRYAWYVGHLVQAVMDRVTSGELYDHFNHVTGKLLHFATQGALDQKFAWMGVNLFEGPVGDIRLDDPKSTREGKKPLSYPAERWNTLHELGDRIDEKVEFQSQGNQYSVTAKAWKYFEVQQFLGLLDRLGNQKASFHGFDRKDWIVLDIEHSDWTSHVARVVNLGNNDKERFQAIMARRPLDVVEYQVADHTLTSYLGQAVTKGKFLWRLRDEGEPLPRAKIILNFA